MLFDSIIGAPSGFRLHAVLASIPHAVISANRFTAQIEMPIFAFLK
jgi:hypothetical protein